MYLYFDERGVLKEIINDEALRQGNYGVNKLNVFIDGLTYSRLDVQYVLESGTIVGNPEPIAYSVFKTEQIPFNAKRDLRYFKYYHDYRFCVIDLEADLEGNGPLDEGGLVHCELTAVLPGGNRLKLGTVNFVVETDSVSQEVVVGNEQYLSLSNYLYLNKRIDSQIIDATSLDNTSTIADLEALLNGEEFALVRFGGDLSYLGLALVKVDNIYSNYYLVNINNGLRKFYVANVVDTTLLKDIPVVYEEEVIDATDFTATTQMETLIERMGSKESALVRFPESISNYAGTKVLGLCLVNLHNQYDTYYRITIDNGYVKYHADNRPSSADIFNIPQKVDRLYMNTVSFSVTLGSNSVEHTVKFNLYSKTDITGATTLNALYSYLANSDSALLTDVSFTATLYSTNDLTNCVAANIMFTNGPVGDPQRRIYIRCGRAEDTASVLITNLTKAITISKIEII